jgi:voltage-gated potassium channel
MVGQVFIDTFVEMKKNYQSIILAVQQGRQGQVITNPPDDYVMADQDYLIVVAEDAPQI